MSGRIILAAGHVGLGLAICMMCGCGQPGTQEVRGSVLLDGAPITEGQIEFSPIAPTQGPIAGAVIQDGNYHVPAAANGLKVGGNYRVSISAMTGSGKFIRNPVAPGGKSEALKEIVPSRYNEHSELQITISPSAAENTHNFELSSKS